MKFLNKFLIFVMLFSLNSFAQDTGNTKSDWGAMLTYSPYDLWLPGKIGVAAVKFEEHRTYELAYERASYNFDFIIDDLGGITDQRLHLTTRGHTFEGTFNFQYGLYISSTSVTLGKTYLGVGVKEDVVSLTNLGVMWGLGNKWAWENGVQFSADWFRIFYPITTLEKDTGVLDEAASADDKDDIEELIDAMSKIPQLTLFHFEIGYRF